MKYIRLSYDIGRDTPLYPGTEPIVVEKVKDMYRGDSCNKSSVKLSNHAGTHIDAPAHFWKTGRKICEYSPEELIFKHPVLVDCPKKPGSVMEIEDICGLVPAGDFDLLLVRTGFYKYRQNDKDSYSLMNPYLSTRAAEWMRDSLPRLKALGIDCISIASHRNREEGRSVHRTLLEDRGEKGGGLLIIEDLYIPESITALSMVIVSPLFIKEADSAPCTVTGVIDD